MNKVRISEIAKELGMGSKDVLAKAKEINFDVRAVNSVVPAESAEQLMKFIMTGEKPQTKSEKKKEVIKVEAPQQTKPTPQIKVKQNAEKDIIEKKPPQEEVKKDKIIEKTTPEKKENSPSKAANETKKVEKNESKKDSESATPVKQPETLASTSLKKRRGLVIVKKRRPVEKSAAEKRISKMPALLENAPRRKKKIKKSGSTGKQHNSERMEIFGGGSINAIDVMGDDQMVVLHDFDLNGPEEKEEKKQTKKKLDPSQMRSTKNSSFIRQRGISRKSTKRRRRRKEEDVEVNVSSIEIPEDIRVYEFAEKIKKTTGEIIKVLFTLGVLVTKNDFLDKDSIEILADEFSVEVTTINPLDEFDYEKNYEREEEGEEEKPPVITIMGHVDHGKTSLLDKIRATKVATGEHGGITQHVGAYMVEKNGNKITFIDTPGHAAFTEMRSRGAKSTDIVIIVVAADDGVKPQTKEAIEHAREANVPFIIALNKIDKPDANPDLAKAGLAELGVTPTDWGGDHEFIHVSAHTGEGIDELLEVILLQAELLELKANPDQKAKASVVESSLEKGRGPVATVIMANGTLRVGDTIVCGIAYGKVRALMSEDNKPLKEIKPGEPGVVLGLSQIPDAGDILMSVDTDKEAREFANKRADHIRQKELSRSTKVTLEDLSERIAEGQIKNLPIILKADVAGSLEALKTMLGKLRNDEVKVNIISSGVGGITESDIALAEASKNAVILGFNIRPTGIIKEKAKKLGVNISTYNIIYELEDDVKGLLGGLLSPIIREENLGQAEVREVFNVPKLGAIAGSIVTDGSIHRGAKVRVIRDGVVIYEGEISSLKRFKDDAKEVAKGYECGIGVVGYSDVKPGDFLESFKEVEEKATL